MIKFKTISLALALAVVFAGPLAAQEEEGAHVTPEIQKQSWSFSGIFGTYDQNQLQRGFQVFREVCASCHGLRLVAFRNLSEVGGPHFSEEQVKALAAEYQIADPEAEGGVRPGVAADLWPDPFPTEADARAAMGGSFPPDLSVMAKARGTTQPFPWWILNYFTAYQEGGPDYIHALLTGYHEPPEGTEIPEGQYYNEVFPGHFLAMPPPLSDGQVAYEEGENGTVPLTLDQYSRDVSAFLMWTADTGLAGRKEAGFRVILFLILFAGLMWATKSRLWRNVHT